MAKRVIRLLEPSLCQECRFREETVVTLDGRDEPAVRCLRRDCDNWDYSEGSPVAEDGGRYIQLPKRDATIDVARCQKQELYRMVTKLKVPEHNDLIKWIHMRLRQVLDE